MVRFVGAADGFSARLAMLAEVLPGCVRTDSHTRKLSVSARHLGLLLIAEGLSTKCVAYCT
jgi:hypothetical protein